MIPMMSFTVTLTTLFLVATIPMMFSVFMVLSSAVMPSGFVMLTLLGFLLQTLNLEQNRDGDVVLCDKGTSCRLILAVQTGV